MHKKKSPVVEQVFLIYKDGRLISYASLKEDEHFDEDIVGSMLTAVVNLVLYAFGKMEEGKANIGEYKFGFGERRLILEMGEHFFIAMVILGTENKSMFAKAEAIVRDIEERYESVVGNWAGDLDDFTGVDEIIVTLLSLEDLSELERMAIWKEGIRDKVFELWSSKYLHLLQKGLIPKAHLWKNLNMKLEIDDEKKPGKKIEERESAEAKQKKDESTG
jgi:hypothetical protein